MVQEGKIRVPAFQRPLRWGQSEVARLFDSVYRGYPIGTLLFWIRHAPAETVKLGPIRVDAPDTKEAMWVVDGQQRITSLAGALLTQAGNVGGAFDLVFDLEAEEFRPSLGVESDTHLPVRGAHELSSVLAWVRARDLSEELASRAFRLAEQLRNYEIPAYKVGAEDEATLREVFDRTNTAGKSMKKSEVFAALTATSSSGGAPDGITQLKADVEALGYGALPEGNTLHYCVLSTRGTDVLRDFRGELKGDRGRAAMRATGDALESVVKFLKNWADVPHFSLIPYQHQTVGLVRFFAVHSEVDDATLELLARWYWQASEVGPLPRKGNTGTLKSTLNAIRPDGAFLSVRRLLNLTSETYSDVDLSGFRMGDASTRIALCAVAHLGPRSLESGELIDPTATIEELGKEAFPKLFHRTGHTLEPSLANRIMVGVSDNSDSVASEGLLELITGADDTVLQSLAISPKARDAAAADDAVTFLVERNSEVSAMVRNFLEARTQRDLAVRPPISGFLDEE